jgi:hypothetical protein
MRQKILKSEYKVVSHEVLASRQIADLVRHLHDRRYRIELLDRCQIMTNIPPSQAFVDDYILKSQKRDEASQREEG